jgi:hypothetical protein
VKHQLLILPHSYGNYESTSKIEWLWALLEKGSLIDLHKSGQVYLNIADTEWPAFLDALQRDVTIYKWDGQDWGGSVVFRKKGLENVDAEVEPDSPQ